MSQSIEPINVPQWLKENKEFFVPPVCNKMMHNQQLKVFFVGGPNQRTDYHIEKGEEFFYMLKGDMCLEVMERGVPKSIEIREGEVFLLPARIPHSPQRKKDTIGLVIERERAPDELDGLRYYVPGTKQILYERWFHCTDLGTQLAPIIKAFLDSNEHRTGVPSANSLLVEAPFQDDTSTRTIEPISLSKWIHCYEEEITVLGHKALFDQSKFATKICIYGGDFKHLIENERYETFVWQLTKNAQVETDEKMFTLDSGNSLVIPPNSKFLLKTHASGYTLVLQMPIKYMQV